MIFLSVSTSVDIETGKEGAKSGTECGYDDVSECWLMRTTLHCHINPHESSDIIARDTNSGENVVT